MTGKVTSLRRGYAEIELLCKTKGEHNCEAHCNACSFFQTTEKKQLTIAKNIIPLEVGDLVEYELEPGGALKSALILLLLPLIAFLITAGIVSALNMNRALIFLISFSAPVITLILLKTLLRDKTYFYVKRVKAKSFPEVKAEI